MTRSNETPGRETSGFASLSRRKFLYAMAGAAAAVTGRLPSTAWTSDLEHPAVNPSLDHKAWLRIAEEGLRPLAKLMAPGKAELPLLGKASNHGAQADRLESFARPCLWAAHWLQCEGQDSREPDSLSREEIAEWFRRGLLHGTDPQDPQYWGPTEDHHQHSVEMAALVLSLDIARAHLWDPLERRDREQIAAWLGSIRGKTLHRNNHLFFGVLTLEFLRREGFGAKGDEASITENLDALETMALGGGWFRDGTNETVDYYNAYAFHYYSIWWGMLHGASDPARKKRWSDWTAQFLPDHARFFAASGENVPFGRSLTYRFNAVAPFALAAKAGISPLSPGLSRRLCSKNLEFFWSRPIRQSQGVIGLGWVDVFPEMTERYSCVGSPYWCAKGLSALLLPPSSDFWQAAEEPLPSEAGDFSHPMEQTGLLVRGVGGEIELANADTAICAANTIFGPYKWGKLGYRTGAGYEVQAPGTDYPLDASLTAQSADGTLHGRQATRALAVEADHLACSYPLGSDVEIESHLWWNGHWQLQLHKYKLANPCRLLLGGQSLATEEESELSSSQSFPRTVWHNRTHHAALHAVHGFESSVLRQVARGKTPRTHIYATNSLTPYLQTATIEGGEGWLAALHGIGPMSTNLADWDISATEAGIWTLRSGGTPDWIIRHPALPGAV